MSYKNTHKAPRCTRCGRLYTEGRRGVCSACLQAGRRTERRKPYIPRAEHSLVCQCGQPAVTVLTVTVGRENNGMYTVHIALCQACLQLEREMWEAEEASGG